MEHADHGSRVYIVYKQTAECSVIVWTIKWNISVNFEPIFTVFSLFSSWKHGETVTLHEGEFGFNLALYRWDFSHVAHVCPQQNIHV